MGVKKNNLSRVDCFLHVDIFIFSHIPGRGAKHLAKIGKLLIVEDDVSLCELLNDHFKQYFQVKIAHDGQAGYDLACDFHPDCIISDVMMPKVSGINMLKLIRRTPGIETTPVILLTVLADDKDRIRGYDHLADLYFSKPFIMEELISSAIGLVTMRKKLKEVYTQSEVKDTIILGSGINDDDRAFLHRLSDSIEQHIGDFDLSVNTIAKAVHITKRQLERRLKQLENMTPAEFIRRTRLEQAKQLADAGVASSLPDLANRVGLRDTRTFIKRFRDHFGYLPYLNTPD
ncbi:response regulator [bacterium]|nr:response regulator [bacterium]